MALFSHFERNKAMITTITLALALSQQAKLEPQFGDDVWNGASGLHDPASSYAPPHAIRALRSLIAASADAGIKAAENANQPEGARYHTEVGLWALASTMTSGERAWYVDHAWKISPRAASLRNRISQAPGLVLLLMRIGDPEDRRHYDLLQAGKLRRADRFDPKLSGLAFYDAYAAFHSFPVPEPRTEAGAVAMRARLIRDDIAGDTAAIRRSLTEAQRGEWDAILRNYRDRTRIIAAGRDPWNQP